METNNIVIRCQDPDVFFRWFYRISSSKNPLSKKVDVVFDGKISCVEFGYVDPDSFGFEDFNACINSISVAIYMKYIL